MSHTFQNSDTLQTPILIIGSGLAGLTAALSLADAHEVLLVCKGSLQTSASWQAQGGISAVFEAPDSEECHVQDTLLAGAYLNDERATRFIVSQGRAAADWLIAQGVPFNHEDGRYHLTREGGHSERRILHVDDMTGRAIQTTLLERVCNHPRIRLLEHHTVVQLQASGQPKRCTGAWLLPPGEQAQPRLVRAQVTLLATGGAGQVFQHATAPGSSTGDGMALAWDLGCRVANLEFLQFHPTCMVYPQGTPFLITEAVRGEGGYLRLPDGERFMARHDPRLELAPRDVVSRAIYSEMQRLNIPAVFLDISHQSPEFVKAHFPNIHKTCLERGIDITRDPIPVAPASHYTCGGVLTDVRGRTDVAQLYALGETACSGLHGANRLASNSLLECVVMARAAAQDIARQPWAAPDAVAAPASWPSVRRLTDRERTAITQTRTELQRVMWDYVGIVRHDASLRAAQRRVTWLAEETRLAYADALPERALLELRSLLTTAGLIVRCALLRRHSLGCHFNEDCPAPTTPPQATVLVPAQSDTVTASDVPAPALDRELEAA
ncbi:L-aspartate oxidase [Hydrogenophaga soli]